MQNKLPSLILLVMGAKLGLVYTPERDAHSIRSSVFVDFHDVVR